MKIENIKAVQQYSECSWNSLHCNLNDANTVLQYGYY